MLLSKLQLNLFWRQWSRYAKREHFGDLEADLERHALLRRAGFDSLTEVDRGPGFDRLLAELGRLNENVARTVELTEAGRDLGDRRRYLWYIQQHAAQLGGLPYALAVARDKFHLTTGLGSIEDLSTPQLLQLVMTLNARARAHAQSDDTIFPEREKWSEPAAANCPF